MIDDIKSKLEKKNLSESSIKAYLNILKKLNDNKPIKTLNYLKKTEKIDEIINKYKPNTQRNILIAIVSILNLYPEYSKLMIKYGLQLKNLVKNIEKEDINEKSEAQDKNWLTYDKVLEKYNELESEVNTFKNKKNINQFQYYALLKYVVLSFYVEQPPRRNSDYFLMNIIYDDNNKNLSKDKNYYVYSTKEFIFNNYKTSKKYGSIKQKIDKKQEEILDIYIKFHPLIKGKLKKKDNIPLLVTFDSKPFNTSNQITRILNSIFGLKIGSSMLRHIFLSSKYGNELKEMKQDAILMGHDLNTQKDYIKE